MSKRQTCKDHLGIEYKTKAEMCRHYGIKYYTFKGRIRAGWSLESALITPEKEVQTEIYDHLGNCYKTTSDMCKHYSIGQPLFLYRVNTLHWSIEKALMTPIKGQEGSVVDHLGNKFSSEREMGEYYGIAYGTFTARRRKGWSIEKILTTPATASNIRVTIFGNKYKSIMDAERCFSLPPGMLAHRIKDSPKYKNFDLELLALLKNLNDMQIAFIGLDGKARYKVPWNKDLQTTRDIIEHERPEFLSLYDGSHPDGEWNPYRNKEEAEGRVG